MARKHFPSEATRGKAPLRAARRSAAAAPSQAHPQLIHGFLVRPTKKSTPGNVPKAAFVVTKRADSAARPRSDPRYEGPLDDTTFH